MSARVSVKGIVRRLCGEKWGEQKNRISFSTFSFFPRWSEQKLGPHLSLVLTQVPGVSLELSTWLFIHSPEGPGQSKRGKRRSVRTPPCLCIKQKICYEMTKNFSTEKVFFVWKIDLDCCHFENHVVPCRDRMVRTCACLHIYIVTTALSQKTVRTTPVVEICHIAWRCEIIHFCCSKTKEAW